MFGFLGGDGAGSRAIFGALFVRKVDSRDFRGLCSEIEILGEIFRFSGGWEYPPNLNPAFDCGAAWIVEDGERYPNADAPHGPANQTIPEELGPKADLDLHAWANSFGERPNREPTWGAASRIHHGTLIGRNSPDPHAHTHTHAHIRSHRDFTHA